MTELTTLLVDVVDHVAWVTLNRPHRLNAFDAVMQSEIAATWQRLERDPEVRCIVVTGAGDRAFCTGIDRDEIDTESTGLRPGFTSPWYFDDPGNRLGPKSAQCWKPVIAAVNGMACGGAFYVLGEVEFVIAAREATFFDPHVTFGMPAAYEPMQMLHRMPFGELMRMTLLGGSERMSAERAHAIGLVSEVVDAADLREAAGWAAAQIAAAPPLAVGASVRAIWAARELSRRQALDLGFLFVSAGTDVTALAQGQEAFAKPAARVPWRLR